MFDGDDRRGAALDSIVASGCIVSGSMIRRSLLSLSVHVHSYCSIEDAVILPHVEIGRRAVLRRVVVDKHCRVPEGLRVGFDGAADAERFHVTEHGVTVITPEMLGQQVHYSR